MAFYWKVFLMKLRHYLKQQITSQKLRQNFRTVVIYWAIPGKTQTGG